MKKFTNTDKNLEICFILGCALVWELLVRILNTPSYIFPAPSQIIVILATRFDILAMHAGTTILESILGLTASIIFGIALAILMYNFRLIRVLLNPIIVISQTIPIVALAPIILILFGIGIFPKILIVMLICFFPITVNTLSGLDSSNKQMIDLLRTMGASKLDILREVVIPSSLEQIFSGLKISATYSVMGAVIGEWLGAQSGLGIFMTRAISSYRADMLFAAVTIIVVLSIGLYKVIEIIERVAMPWKKVSLESEWEK